MLTILTTLLAKFKIQVIAAIALVAVLVVLFFYFQSSQRQIATLLAENAHQRAEYQNLLDETKMAKMRLDLLQSDMQKIRMATQHEQNALDAQQFPNGTSQQVMEQQTNDYWKRLLRDFEVNNNGGK